ncbi:Pentatricopeptide repeat-containing protein, chloroplastic [Turnera subulata]|uniref:Pentatricopeptide repeat-containing protein, chloroplastic n=1 Tax=Turnera subulata TaxID=218843 RepID=A0A9Q0F9X5_9ROSI|nr:Pentatricopeptide repeat-containing protein, chloroplastic [Turnera subulata]
MISQGFPPDKFTFPFAIRACRVAGALEKGKEVHGFAIKTGFINDTVLFNSLMCLYLECRDVDYGRRVFDKMRVRNVVSWTTLIAGLIACGDLDAASRAFRKMPDRNVVSWTALIDGYVRNQLPQEAFKLFRGMQLHNVRPNEFTLVSLLKASTQLGSLKLGGWVHDYILKNGFEVGAFLGTALIDMYSKCGSLEDARQVFDKMEIKTLATWNAMITSLGVHGYGMEAIDLFAEMVVARVRPDAVTFVGVLCACVRMNDVEQGYRYFKYMRKYYGIKPILEHYSCMIELYRRADLLDEVRELVNSMRMQLNGDVAEEWIRKISSDSVVDLDKLSEPHDQGLDYLGTPTSLLRDQLQCFKWDAG